ncbi:MAG: hypothetical protein J6D34_04390 [Atopobiaceae bacterium]|nr:hypothetical protein [Atopobiaceae bacterium]
MRHPYTAPTLEQTLGTVPQASVWESLYEISDADRLYDMRGDLQVVRGIGEFAWVTKAATGASLLEYDARPPIGAANVAQTGLTGIKLGEDTLLCRYGSELVCISPLTGERRWQARLPLADNDLSASVGSDVLCLVGLRQFVVLSMTADAEDSARCLPTLGFYEESTGRLAQTVALPSMLVGDGARLDVRHDESVFAVGMGNQVAVFDQGASVLVSGMAADVAEGLKVVELSSADGTTKGAWALGEGILSLNPTDVRFTRIVSWEGDSGVMLFATSQGGRIVNLDASTVASKFDFEEGRYFATSGYATTASSHIRWLAFTVSSWRIRRSRGQRSQAILPASPPMRGSTT